MMPLVWAMLRSETTKRWIYILVLALFIYACAGNAVSPRSQSVPSGQPQATKTPSTKERLSEQQQQEAAAEVFKEILSVYESAPDRQTAVKKAEELYVKIITEYPDAPLAQESYFRLIQMYLRDFNPPRLKDAETTYKRLRLQYPESPMLSRAKKTLGRFYFAKKLWRKVLELYSEDIKEFINIGSIAPEVLFMYSEARYNLGHVKEAIKGYKWILKKFPQTAEAYRAKKRLKQLAAYP